MLGARLPTYRTVLPGGQIIGDPQPPFGVPGHFY
jgi:hypothetical protein